MCKAHISVLMNGTHERRYRQEKNMVNGVPGNENRFSTLYFFSFLSFTLTSCIIILNLPPPPREILRGVPRHEGPAGASKAPRGCVRPAMMPWRVRDLACPAAPNEVKKGRGGREGERGSKGMEGKERRREGRREGRKGIREGDRRKKERSKEKRRVGRMEIR